MNWFFTALVCVLGWGCADLFYKTGSSEEDEYSYLKIAVWVGLVMGITGLVLLFVNRGVTGGHLGRSLLSYLPASASYIASMVIGYAGLRYLELSIVSPVQNASGALSMIAMILFFSVTGRGGEITDSFSGLDLSGVTLIVAGMIALAITEQKIAEAEGSLSGADSRYRKGALALLYPLLYCLFDTIGTAADGIILNEEAGLSLSETDVLILYGFTFFLFGVIAFWILRKKTGHFYHPFQRSELPKCAAALCEEFGQVFYVYAMAENPVLAAPMVASYCIVSVLLSRIFLREKLKVAQYACIIAVIAGIVLLGISEGLAERI